MIKRALTLWGAMLAMLFFAGAVSAKPITDASLNKLLDLSGIDKQVHAIPLALKSAIAQFREHAKQQKNNKLTDENFDTLEQALSDALNPGDILDAVGASLREKLTEADARELIRWYESSLGKQFAQAQRQAATAAGRKDMVAHAQKLSADKRRMAFARRVEKTLHLTDNAMQVRERGAIAMYTAMSALLHPGQPIDTNAFKAREEAMLHAHRSDMETAVALRLVYVSRNFDMAALKKYEAFLNRPATRRFNAAMQTGLLAGLDRGVARIPDNISRHAGRGHH